MSGTSQNPSSDQSYDPNHHPQQQHQQQQQQQLFLQQFFDKPIEPSATHLPQVVQFDNSDNNTNLFSNYPQPPIDSLNMQLPFYPQLPLSVNQHSLPFRPHVGRSTIPPPRRALTEREQFLVFVKILFKCLKQAQEDRISRQAQTIVFECTRRNRRGEHGFSPLQSAVEKHLRTVVGERYWMRAQLYYEQYCATKGIRRLEQAAAV